MSVRVCVIGAGEMANRVHYPSLAAIEAAELVGVCDLREDQLHQTCDHYGIEGRFTDYRRMLGSLEPDAVYIIMPPHHLYDLTIDCY